MLLKVGLFFGSFFLTSCTDSSFWNFNIVHLESPASIGDKSNLLSSVIIADSSSMKKAVSFARSKEDFLSVTKSGYFLMKSIDESTIEYRKLSLLTGVSFIGYSDFTILGVLKSFLESSSKSSGISSSVLGLEKEKASPSSTSRYLDYLAKIGGVTDDFLNNPYFYQGVNLINEASNNGDSSFLDADILFVGGIANFIAALSILDKSFDFDGAFKTSDSSDRMSTVMKSMKDWSKISKMEFKLGEEVFSFERKGCMHYMTEGVRLLSRSRGVFDVKTRFLLDSSYVFSEGINRLFLATKSKNKYLPLKVITKKTKEGVCWALFEDDSENELDFSLEENRDPSALFKEIYRLIKLWMDAEC